MQLSEDELRAEQDNIQFLASMMGGDLDPEVARQVLRKHNGNVEKAADAILQGDRGEDNMWLSSQNTGSTISPSQIPPAPTARVIDLTEDDDMNRALQLSIETSHSEVHFGPSNRAPDPAWQMVPSNVGVNSAPSQEDQHLNEAIRASLKDLPLDEPDDPTFEETVREGGRPVALRPESPDLAYAALIFQALFHIPQVREQIALFQLPPVDEDTPQESSARTIMNMVEYFVNLDLAQLSTLVDKYMLTSLQAQPLNMNMNIANLIEYSSEFLRSMTTLIVTHLNSQRGEDEPESRLFYFRHGTAEYYPNVQRKVRKIQDDGSIVVVDVGLENLPNDLVGALSANLSRYTDTSAAHDVIIDPSDVVIFQLHYQRETSQSRQPLDTFVYPKTIFLDQFLLSNVDDVHKKRQQERDMKAEIANLATQKEALTQYNNRDSLTELRSTLHYYENVAQAHGDSDRQRRIVESCTKLRLILTAINAQLEAIDKQIEKLRMEQTRLFDSPEFQNYRYDLRAVLVHSGLPGRKHIYSYVQDVEGTWWKTVDFTVTEVPEEIVLSDPTGLHLNAGPYLLFYSRYVPPEQLKVPIKWPSEFAESVEESNKKLLSIVPPEVAAKAKIPTAVSPNV
ncbi:hypothetical protein AMATHDRAFT_59718 [Amanita thiersii Skay4041]|uniref:USP domain-containing protein n=1 Tax=Amanita thiersii Skay4041 TaxID=703135 RepID=A0A2A9NKV2_9AGAR|nr:hypothetical protein AMATHDRAFT_59718 [Amanita thiersii Skay4041]